MIPVYYGKPPKLLDLPNCVSMSHATARLYDCLWALSDRYSSFQVEVTDDEIIKRTGLSKGALNIGRKDLDRRGLVLCNRQQRGHRYLLLDPETLQPYSANPKQRIIYKKKSASLTDDTAAPVVIPAVSPDATRDLPETMRDAREEQTTPYVNGFDYSPGEWAPKGSMSKRL